MATWTVKVRERRARFGHVMPCHAIISNHKSKITATAPIKSSNYNETIRGLCLKLGSCHSPIEEKTVGWRSRALHPFQPMAGFTTMKPWRMVWDGGRPMTFAQFVWKKRGLASDGSDEKFSATCFYLFFFPSAKDETLDQGFAAPIMWPLRAPKTDSSPFQHWKPWHDYKYYT